MVFSLTNTHFLFLASSLFRILWPGPRATSSASHCHGRGQATRKFQTRSLGFRWRVDGGSMKLLITSFTIFSLMKQARTKVRGKGYHEKCQWNFKLGSFLSVDRLSLQHLVCRFIIFHRRILSKNAQETQSLKSRRSSFPSLLIFFFLSFSLSLLHESEKNHSESWSTERYALVFQNRLFHFAN